MKDYSIDLRVFPFNDVEKRFYYVIIDNNKYLMPVAFSIDMRHEKIFEKSYSEIKDLVKEKDLQEFIVTIKTNNLENV